MTVPNGNDLSWAIIWGSVGALIAGLFSWLVQRIKSGADIEVAVLAQWEKLNGALSLRLSTVEREFADYRNKMAAEIEEIHAKHNHEIDEMRNQHRAEMRTLRENNEGLQRAIAQNSQSTANLLGDMPKGSDE